MRVVVEVTSGLMLTQQTISRQAGGKQNSERFVEFVNRVHQFYTDRMFDAAVDVNGSCQL